MSSIGAVPFPRAVAWLGYGGLLPFIGLALAIVRANFLGEDPQGWNAALLAYGAAILSFVGALHWGFAMTLRGLNDGQRTAAFAWSVVPALMAWVALLVAPKVAVVLLVVGFLSHYWRDHRLASAAELPAWYLPMRLRLTWVACLCLVAPVVLKALLR
jgi:Protein of unknown function (DUF3429)